MSSELRRTTEGDSLTHREQGAVGARRAGVRGLGTMIALASILGGCAGDLAPEPKEVSIVRSALTVCKTATSTWSNTALPTQTGTFTAEYDVVPKAKPIDSVVGLSSGPQTAYTGFATLTRFGTSGNIDARNGGSYAAASAIAYSANVSYHFRLVVNVPARTYSAYVTPAGGTEKAIGIDFAFRSEQSTVSQLDSWGTASGSGSADACGVDIGPAPLVRTSTMIPIADAFVKDGAPSTNFGTVTAIEVKTPPSAGTLRYAYIKYNLASFSNITGAKLRLRGKTSKTTAGSINTGVYAVANTSWGETTITWGNKPALGSSLGSFLVINADSKFYELDVTSYVKAEKSAGRNLVTLGLKNAGTNSEYVTFIAREGGYNDWNDGSKIAPELVITTTDPPAKPSILHDTIDPYLATPAAGALYTVPVVIIRYFPTKDGVTLDPARTTPYFPANTTLDTVLSRTKQFDSQIKFMLEEGSRFRGYANPSAPPSLGYKIVDIITLYDEVPDGLLFPPGPNVDIDTGVSMPDYVGMLKRAGAQQYVEGQGVKEFWFWTPHAPHIRINESWMSSPSTEPVSNHWRTPERLPVYNKTYIVYTYGYPWTAAEAVHNHGHQQEAEFDYANKQQDGNNVLYSQAFVGYNPASPGSPPLGRVGDTHYPPNGVEYGYTNPDIVMSDIKDWRPQGGAQTSVNNVTWDSLVYNWPGGVVPDKRTESQWYLLWRQSVPGRGNLIQDAAGQYMTNWWRLAADWDGAHAAAFGLHAPTPTAP
jgi:hypothetical protein